MRSPLELSGTLYKYRNVIRSLIPKDVSNLVFPAARDMELEFYFSKKYNITCSTYDYRVYDFWDSYLSNPSLVFSIAKKLLKSIEFDNYTEISEIYYSQPDQNIRSALFLLMNRCGNQIDFFKDSFNLRKAVDAMHFLNNHAHFVPHNVVVEYANLSDRLGHRSSFTILELPSMQYKNHISVVADTSFTEKELIGYLKNNTSWCLVTKLTDGVRKYVDDFNFYYLDDRGNRSLSETNKILFFKNN